MQDVTNARHNPDLPDDIFQEILNSYKSKIKLPASKPAKQFVLCPVGLIGAGKTTIIKPLAEKLNLPRVSSDEIREMLSKRGFNYDRARELAFVVAKDLIDSGYSIAVDSNCGSEYSLEKIKEFEEKYRDKIKLIWIRINPPDSFVINKLRNYRHTWLFKNGEQAVGAFLKYKEKYADFSHLNLSYSYVFDPSKPNLDEQIERAAEIINGELARTKAT